MSHFNLSHALISKEKTKNNSAIQITNKQTNKTKTTKKQNIEGGEETDWTAMDILSPRSQANNQQNKSKPQIKNHA